MQKLKIVRLNKQEKTKSVQTPIATEVSRCVVQLCLFTDSRVGKLEEKTSEKQQIASIQTKDHLFYTGVQIVWCKSQSLAAQSGILLPVECIWA